jgi:hypothetical protein
VHHERLIHNLRVDEENEDDSVCPMLFGCRLNEEPYEGHRELPSPKITILREDVISSPT